MSLSINRAADVLLGGGIIAYPTEGVFGLGCMPDDLQAITRLIEIKQRDPAKGLILIAAKLDQLKDWVAGAGGSARRPGNWHRTVRWQRWWRTSCNSSGRHTKLRAG